MSDLASITDKDKKPYSKDERLLRQGNAWKDIKPTTIITVVDFCAKTHKYIIIYEGQASRFNLYRPL